MVLVDIKGIPVNFPFEPYSIQKDYMGKVIEALNNKENAVLESPTGEDPLSNDFVTCDELFFVRNRKNSLPSHKLAGLAQ
jgi:regulator of telomere elongation helicase 1